jgi:hypothetical protein
MSFTRIKYDNDAYDLKLDRETGPGDYRLLLESNENCSRCITQDGPRNSRSDVAISKSDSTNLWGPMAEAESYLTNRVNKLTDSNIYGANDAYKKLNVTNTTVCNKFVSLEDTRFTNPIEAYRCMDLTAYHYSPFLHVSAQCEIQDDRIGLNSRLKVKDTFKVNKPTPVDQTLALPPNAIISNSQMGAAETELCSVI